MRILLIYYLFATSYSLHAEGIPIDSLGNIFVQHFTLNLTEDQKAELEHSRQLILTEIQKKSLRNFWPYDKVDVLDPHHKDCTCGMFYAIWISPNQIAFLGDTTSLEEGNILENEDQFEVHEKLNTDYQYRDLYIGINGAVYYQNNRIELNSIESIMRSILDIDAQKKYIIIYVAPKKDNLNWNKISAVKSKIDALTPSEAKVIWM